MRFLVTDVPSIHIVEYETRLKEIDEKLHDFDDTVAELIIDLGESNSDDKQN